MSTSDDPLEALRQQITRLERENRTLRGQLENADPTTLARLKAENTNLKNKLAALEKALALELADRKTPIDAESSTDKLQVLKTACLAYCSERKLDQSLWKKLESL